MKKLLFTLFVVCLATGVFAQLSGGLKAGLNMAKQNWELGSEEADASGTSFHIGGYVNFALSDALSLQPELLYNSLKLDGDAVDDVTLNYLSIPVMFLYGFSDNKFNIQAGPQLGLLLSSDPSEIKDEDFMTGTDFSLAFGAGANFGKFNAAIRYNLGLSNIAGDAAKDLIGDDLSIKNNNLQISLGYKLFGE
jgi:hypothetical protein